MGGQTNYNLTPNPGQPGQLLDNERSNQDIVTVLAGVVIPFGVLCELNSVTGLAQPVKDSTTGGSFAPALCGISVLDTVAVEQAYQTYQVPASGTGSSLAGYPVGYPVPFLRRGRIWASWDGNTGTALPRQGAIQVWHSSDGSHSQGIFTTLAVSATAGAEIDLSGAYIGVWDPNLVSGAFTDSFGNVVDIVAIAINLPGHS